MVEGSLLSAAGDTLIDTAGALADVECLGDSVMLRGPVTDFRIYAPDAGEVMLNGGSIPFLRHGDYVIEPAGTYNLPPVAVAGGPYAGQPGAVIQFDGSDSTDPEGEPLTFSWEFGDGTTADGASPTHVYAEPDDYVAVLTVHDGYRSSEPVEFWVSITGTAGAPAAPVVTESPASSRLYGAFPNPTFGSTVIRFDLAAGDGREGTALELGIYDASGRLVRALHPGPRDAGTHEVFWDGRTAAGAMAPNGVYFIRLVAPDIVETRKVLLAR
jgi:hypothetical protein